MTPAPLITQLPREEFCSWTFLLTPRRGTCRTSWARVPLWVPSLQGVHVPGSEGSRDGDWEWWMDCVLSAGLYIWHGKLQSLTFLFVGPLVGRLAVPRLNGIRELKKKNTWLWMDLSFCKSLSF